MRLLVATVASLSYGFAVWYFGWLCYREVTARRMTPEDERVLVEMYDRDPQTRLSPQESAALAAYNAQKAARRAKVWARVALAGTVISAVAGVARLLSHC